MTKRRQGAKGGPSSSASAAASNVMDSEEPKIDIKSILKEIEFVGSAHMTWKEKKDLENRKVVSLGGKAPKKQRLPLSVARPMMKKQKEREEKMLEERVILGRFGGIFTSSGPKKEIERRRPEDRVLRSTVGDFRNGVLDVKHLLKSSAPQAPPVADDSYRHGFSKGKKKKGGNKGHGKRKGGGRKRH